MHTRRAQNSTTGRAIALVALGMTWAGVAEARDFRVGMLPNGSAFRCQNCHVSASGGGTRNAFGQAVFAITGSSSRQFWSPTLAALDSDGDGFANGEELGDPEGDATTIAGHKATNPGNATSKPVVNAAPTVSVTGPAAGAVLTAPALDPMVVTATDSDGTVAKVEFFLNGTLLGSATTAPYSLVVDWPIGSNSLTARAVDDKGLAATSAAVTVTVNAPEAPTMGALVTSGASGTVSWTGGGGPFAVQSKPAMSDPWCSVNGVVIERSASVATTDAAGFFRVVDMAAQAPIPMSALLSGAFERPTPVTTTGAGSATFKLAGNTLTFDIRYEGLSGPATLAHIHGPAGTDASAGVLVNLAPFNGGEFGTSGSLSGSVILTAEQKAAVLSGKTYVNIHTDANKPGEIRGQILPVMMQASLSGANERPNAVATSGVGSGLFLLAGDQLTFSISYSGLSGPATLAHIHGPADAANSAGVLVNLAPFNGGAFGVSGSLAGTVTLTPEQLSAVAAGLTYVNIHTDANKPGEIRGQILPCVTATPLTVALSGAAERPTPVATSGAGTGILALEGDTLLFNIQYGGLSGPATLAHFHGPATAAESAGVQIDLAPFNGGAFGVAGTLAGRVTLTPEQRALFLAGRIYANVHTEANKPGEIRGQVTQVLKVASLSGANEKPTATTSAGTGTAHLLLVGNSLWLNATYRGLTGAATLAHIHGPADANNSAGVLVDLAPLNGGSFGASGTFAGRLTLAPETLAALVDGLTYLNVHTDANKPGEIRGQVVSAIVP